MPDACKSRECNVLRISTVRLSVRYGQMPYTPMGRNSRTGNIDRPAVSKLRECKVLHISADPLSFRYGKQKGKTQQGHSASSIE